MIESLVRLYDDNTRTARFADLRQLATEYNMEYEKRLSVGHLPTPLKSMRAIDSNGVRRLLGVISDPTREFRGRLRCYDYLRTKDLETKAQTIIEITRDDIRLPYFRIYPKSILSKARDLFVVQHPFFPDLEDFHTRYQVETEDIPPENILVPAALELLSTRTGLTVEGRDQFVIFYRDGKEMEVPEIASILDFAEGVVALLNMGRGGML